MIILQLSTITVQQVHLHWMFYNYSHSADFFKLYAEVVVGKDVELNLDSKYGLASTRRDYKDMHIQKKKLDINIKKN